MAILCNLQWDQNTRGIHLFLPKVHLEFLFFRKSVLPNESVIELILKTMFDASQLTKQEIQEVTIILIGFLKVAGDQTGCLTLHIFTEDEKENVEIVNTNSTQCINVP